MRTICIFAKPPLPGKAKTRLIPALGSNGAAAVARALLKDVVDAAVQVPDSHVVISASEVFQAEESLPVWLQPEGDLGVRIERTLQLALKSSDVAVAVGADTPGLTPAMLAQAFDTLQNKDAVLGPTNDGGYYLVGARCCPDGLFQNIRWSNKETLQDTLRRFDEFKLDYGVGPEWFDLDTPDDWRRVQSAIRAGFDLGAC